MLLTKLKVASWAVGVVLLAGAGTAGLFYQTAVAQPTPQARSAYGVAQGANVTPAPKVGRPAPDDLESLRLEIEALRRELRATKETVRELQAEVRGKQGADKVRQRDLERLRLLDGARRIDEQARKLADEQLDNEQPKRNYEQGKQLTGDKTTRDPLAELEDAVKRLRKNPQDKKAAEALDRAMRKLKEQPKPNNLRPQGQKPFGN